MFTRVIRLRRICSLRRQSDTSVSKAPIRLRRITSTAAPIRHGGLAGATQLPGGNYTH
jgi:hypothetical protein